MVRKIFFTLGVIVVIGFVLLLVRSRSPRKAIPDLIELPARQERPAPASPSGPTLASTSIPTASPPATASGSIQLLFDQPLSSAEVVYPELYAYDVSAGIYRVFNLADHTYRDLYANPNLIRAWRSPSGRYLAIEQRAAGRPHFAVLDLNRDRLQPLDALTQRLVWTDRDDLILHLTNQSRVNVLARWRAGQVTLLGPTGLLAPRFAALGDRILVTGSHDAPLLSLDPTTGDHRIILTPRRFVALLGRSGAALVMTFDRSWQTLLFNQTNQAARSFNWGSFPEKCTLAIDFVVCGTPKNIAALGAPEDWLEWRTSSADDLVFFNRTAEVETRVALDGQYDILGPALTPLGLVFTNRFDSRLYLVPSKQLPLERGPAKNDQPVQRKK